MFPIPATHTLPENTQSTGASRHKGFTLVELLFVLIVLAVLYIFAAPKVKAFIIDGRINPTATDFIGATLRIRANAEGQGNSPYSGVATSTLGNSLRDRSKVMVVTGNGAATTVQHRLGATGSQVTCASATITTAGDSFACTFPTVNSAACPSLATSLQNNAEIVSINGTVVYSSAATGNAVTYSGQTAQDLCTADDTNTFVFTMR